uniref:Uncharacterized protein n=1 Tax=Nelumbo nucifera TaxID=4432 RepID=A0A822YUY3_NELNU|nr:TPA_asm: hypothetical protein HUJ06_011909 [Nelumbo nucifera]
MGFNSSFSVCNPQENRRGWLLNESTVKLMPMKNPKSFPCNKRGRPGQNLGSKYPLDHMRDENNE